MQITKMTIEELMREFEEINDKQEHPIFNDDSYEFTCYTEAFGCWIVYELLNDEVSE